MKRYKLFIVAALTGFGVMLNSCSEDFLQKNPPGALAESVLASVDGIEALLIGAYAEVDGLASWSAGDMWRSTTTNWVYGDVYADDATKGSDIGDQPTIVPIERYQHDSQNPYFNTKWLAMYDGVSRCNDVLRILQDAIDNGSVDQTLADAVTAETLFLRAFFHLELIKMFDYVVYVDGTAESDLIPNAPASSLSDGDLPWSQSEGDGDIPWEGFEADMQAAIDNLPDAPRNGEVGRATKSAAQALMAKAKLYQGDYGAAATLLDAVIASPQGYSLAPRFDDNFRIAGDNNSESIFQVQASVNDGSGAAYNGNYGDILNFPYTGGPGACCGFYQPTFNLVNAYKTTDGTVGGVIAGLPYLNAFGLDYNAAGDDVISDMGIGSGDAFTEETRPLDPRLDWTVGRRGIPYLDWGDHPGRDWIRDQGFGGPYAPKKAVYYQSEEGTGSNAGGWGGGTSANNYSIVRLADVLLMRAECHVEANQLGPARTLVNQVRARMNDATTWVKEADGTTNAANYIIAEYPAAGAPFDSQANAREAVRMERRLEMAMEGHRFWDLKRWGGTKTYLQNYIDTEGVAARLSGLAGSTFDDRDIRFPIPQTAIERSEGTLTQNPGY